MYAKRRQNCYNSPPEEVGVFSTEIKKRHPKDSGYLFWEMETISDVRWLPPLQVVRSKLVSVVGVNPPSDIASGRIAEMRKRNMSCFA